MSAGSAQNIRDISSIDDDIRHRASESLCVACRTQQILRNAILAENRLLTRNNAASTVDGAH